MIFRTLMVYLAKALCFVSVGRVFGRIAQSVEQLPFKQTVGGSNPSAPTKQIFLY